MKNRIFIENSVSRTSSGHFLYNRLKMNPLRRIMQQTVKLNVIRARVGSLETLIAATKYKMIRTISSNPVQYSDALVCRACGEFQ